MVTNAEPILEALPELDPLRRSHVCGKCGECWAFVDTRSIGLVAWVVCPNGHRGSVFLLDLPVLALAGV